MTDVIGWLSSIVLLATIVSQIAKQWSERSGEGVSPWLFAGQTVASAGFTAYSALTKNWVFTVTNGLMLVSAILGWGITAHFRRHTPGPATTAVARSHAGAPVSPHPVP
jgi:MtN3 and saliva related transmembrane protein